MNLISIFGAVIAFVCFAIAMGEAPKGYRDILILTTILGILLMFFGAIVKI